MKKIILLFIAISIFGCSKDTDAIQPVSNVEIPRMYKLIKETRLRYYDNTIRTINYTYSPNMIKTQEGTDNYTEFAMIDNKIQNYKNYTNGVLKQTHTFSYVNGLITNEQITFDNDVPTTFVYTYNSLNQLINSKEYKKGVFLYSLDYVNDSRGNIIKRIGLSGTSNNYEYDNYKNQSSLVFNDAMIKVDDDSRHSLNNITKETHSYGIETNVYTYNTDGYPIQKIHYTNGVASYKTDYIYQ